MEVGGWRCWLRPIIVFSYNEAEQKNTIVDCEMTEKGKIGKGLALSTKSCLKFINQHVLHKLEIKILTNGRA